MNNYRGVSALFALKRKYNKNNNNNKNKNNNRSPGPIPFLTASASNYNIKWMCTIIALQVDVALINVH